MINLIRCYDIIQNAIQTVVDTQDTTLSFVIIDLCHSLGNSPQTDTYSDDDKMELQDIYSRQLISVGWIN